MKKFLNTMFFTLLLIVIAGAGIYVGYSAVRLKESETADISPQQNLAYALNPQETLAKPMPANSERGGLLLNKDAKLVFEYRYMHDGLSVVKEQDLPYFLAGKDEEDIAAVFSDWQIISFNQTGAMLKKDIAPPDTQHYFVTALNGYIAVFYDESIDGQKLKEITDTPISTLPESERERLNSGILVYGEAALIRLLEDLSS